MSLFGQDKERPKQITATHVLAAQALAAGKTTAEAAAIAGVSERIVYEWKKGPWFSQLVEDYVSSMVAAAKLDLPGVTLLSKKNRLVAMQELYETLKVQKPNKAGEAVQVAKAQLDVLQAVSKELGEEGQPLHGKDEETGLPVVISLDHPGVILPNTEGPHAEQ